MRSNFTTNSLQELLSQIEKLSPKNREEMKEQVAKVLGESLISILDTHNTQSVIIAFLNKSKKYVVKVELRGETGSVDKEINWYLKVGASFSNCPKYLGSVVGKNITALILSYIDNSLTIDEMVFQSKIDTNQTWKLIREAVKFLNSLFENKPKRKISLIEADALFIEKYESRFIEAQSCEYLQKLLSLKSLYINGRTFPNFDFYISKIVKDQKLREFLTPNVYGIIHGDLHCGNILVKNNRVYMVDPNGNLSMPIEYDYGKILHSIHGGYGSIINGNYKLTELGEDQFGFSIQIPEIYTVMSSKFIRTIPPDLFVRSFYAEAMHFATMLPHHASNEAETKALFIRGVMVFKELFDLLDSN
ncbi:phosphotransferase [Candidatus Microgenomates bacterium]|nr:phosphotransferase [Candidatus Microgenomates bacterium]